MLWVACFGLILNWCGDSLDGSLARYRGIERPRYGFFVDHSADVLSQLLIFFGLGVSPFMRFDMALLALMSYWLAAFYTFIRAIATQVFQISYFGIGPTEIRLGLLAYSLVVLVAPPFTIATPVGKFSPLDAAVLVSFCVVLVTFTLAAYAESRRLSVLEPMPGRPVPRKRAA
jgi:phosphatidylglycerophosphate synthase